MRCWFHDWSRWSEAYQRVNYRDIVREYQQRRCNKCRKIEERMI
jgi:hypothetical protein